MMYVISKKRISMVLMCLLLGISVYLYQGTEKFSDEIIQETTSVPVSGKVIVIDAGHGVPDEGAESSSRYNRSGNKFKNSFKTSKLIRAKWIYYYINSFR